MDALISVAGKVSEYTVAPIGRQVGYLIFYKNNFKELTDQIKELEGARDRIKHLAEAERRNGKEIETAVQNWLDRADEVIQEANQLLEDPQRAKVGCSIWSFPNLIARHQLSRKAMKMAKSIGEVLRKGKFDQVGHLPPLGGIVSISTTRDCGIQESRKSIKEDLLQALRDPKVSKIGVFGLGGVGKTTLVKEVARKAKDDKLYDEVIMAHVSRTPDLRRIQGEIADHLGLRFDEETVAGRSCRLHERIKKEKTILIILDDIWTRLDLEKVGIPSGDVHDGCKEKVEIPSGDVYNVCKVLMTSRSQNVLREMEAQKDFRLEVLSEEETWNLFKVMAGDVDEEPSLQQIASEVAKKCGGLPLLIVMVARTLKNQDVHVWKDALNQLARVDNPEWHEITSSALELSYNRLEGSEMKDLFLLCASLTQEPWINELLKYGMGLGIFKHINTIEDARNKLHKMLGALKASCLLLEDNTNVHTVKMHDVVRDAAISMASRDQKIFTVKESAELKEWPTNELLERCPQIYLWDISELPTRLDCPKLKIFTMSSSNRTLKISDSFFERMESLRALDLSDLDIDYLPTSFHSLTNLQTLGFYQCTLEDMAAMGALKNLKFLTLYNSSMTTLPVEIGQLNDLRLLDLTNSKIEFFPPNIISSLTKLEELCMGNTSINWEIENSEKQSKNASLAELRQLSKLAVLELQIREAWILPRDLMFEKLERYKIVIGDVWEWSDIELKTLKILKLKLPTNIHWEHGITALIRRVEILYLDEVDGISNVVYQLNGEGFPFLKHLHIQNTANIKQIIDSTERNRAPASFPNLETLVLHNLHNLEMICHGPLAVNSFSKLKVIKVQNCDRLTYLLSFSMVKELSRLLEIEVCKCDHMKTVFVDSNTNADNDIILEKIVFSPLRSLTLQHLQTLDCFHSNELTVSTTERNCQRLASYIPMPFFSAKVEFSYLETLKLSSINLNKIWDHNQHSVPKLTNLIVEECGGLKYLFSATMVGSFLNLERLEISKCHMMEGIIATEEGNDGGASREVRFSKLEKIALKDMKNLKTVWHSQFDTLKTLEVQNCEKIMVVFPSSMQRTYHNLETLVVTDCASVEEIFELVCNETSSKEDTTKLKELTLNGLPKLKQTWSRDPQGILSFHSLQEVQVEDCENLEYLFPLSVATSCFHLKMLIVKCCGVTEIVPKKEGSLCRTNIFEFNELDSLVLGHLHKLKRFFAGNYTLVCPSLRIVSVVACEKLNLFKTQSMSSLGRTTDGKLQVSMQDSLFTVEEVIPRLETLTLHASTILGVQLQGVLFSKLKSLRLHGFKNKQATFPYWLLQNAPSLELLGVCHSSFKEILCEEKLVREEGQTEISIHLKSLWLQGLPELRHISKGGSQIDRVFDILESIWVRDCSGLINLVPSSVTFSHLTYLKIKQCNGLINLITSSTARSLAKLRTMIIKECNSLEEIVTIKGDETIFDIAFVSLEILNLECLPKLNKFCSSKCFLRFPLLKEVVVKQCPRMKTFSDGKTSTPNLRKVQIAETDEEVQCNGNLNDTIKNMFEDMVAFCSIEHLTLSENPELKDLWYGYNQLPHNMFCNLKSLTVKRCDFLSDVLFASNLLQVLLGLEELEVRDCDSLETVFDVKGMKSKEVLVKQTTKLKKLTLSNLPSLKHIWNNEPQEIISFGNLCMVDVVECQRLVNLLPFSLCQDLGHLEKLDMESCGVEEIVATEEGSTEKSFSFPQLTRLRLIRLTNLGFLSKKAYFGVSFVEDIECIWLSSISNACL